MKKQAFQSNDKRSSSKNWYQVPLINLFALLSTFSLYLWRASREARLAALGPFINWGSGLPGMVGLDVTIEGLCSPNGDGIPAAETCAADKKAGCWRAINWAATGFSPGGPPGGPNPFPKGFLSSLGSARRIYCKMTLILQQKRWIFWSAATTFLLGAINRKISVCRCLRRGGDSKLVFNILCHRVLTKLQTYNVQQWLILPNRCLILQSALADFVGRQTSSLIILQYTIHNCLLKLLESLFW